MSANVFIRSSILNCSTEDMQMLKHYLEKHVKKPKVYIDDAGDLIIEEDFDRRHIETLLSFLEKREMLK